MDIKNMDLDKIRQVFFDYWSLRAQTYSDDMSKLDFRDDWKAELKNRIDQQFPGRDPGSIKVLELCWYPGGAWLLRNRHRPGPGNA